MESLHEEWRPVLGRPGYEASSIGRIRSIPRTVCYRDGRVYRYDGQLLQHEKLNSAGYYQIMLGRGCRRLVHKVIAEAFHGPRPDGMQINHKDGNKLNNAASNLEYVTKNQNMKHAYDNGMMSDRRGEKQAHAKLTEVQAIEIIRRYKAGESPTKIAREFGIKQCTVSTIGSGYRWKHLHEHSASV